MVDHAHLGTPLCPCGYVRDHAWRYTHTHLLHIDHAWPYTHTHLFHITHAWLSATRGHMWPLVALAHRPRVAPACDHIQVRSCAFLLSSHGHCRKDTFFRLFIKETPGQHGPVNLPEWYQRDFGRSVDAEDGGEEDDAEGEDLDEDGQEEQQACPCLVNMGAHAWSLLSLSTYAHAWPIAVRRRFECPGRNRKPVLRNGQ